MERTLTDQELAILTAAATIHKRRLTNMLSECHTPGGKSELRNDIKALDSALTKLEGCEEVVIHS